MSTLGIRRKPRGKHARVTATESQNTERSKRLAGASLALVLSASSAAFMQGATSAFAAVPEENAAANTIEQQSEAANSNKLFLAASSVSACMNALTIDLGQGTSLLDAAHYDAQAAAQQARADNIEAIVDEALSHLGVRYRYGGTTPAGFDCSGFTSYVFRNTVNMELPRTAGAQSKLGQRVSLADAERGDLLFWVGRQGGIYHTGIYLGNGEYIHAAASGKVKIATFGTFRPTFAARML